MAPSNPIVQIKAEAFAIRIANAYKYLTQVKHEHIMSKQVYRSGTSISANISEAQFAQSKPDFVSKMQIALKEANETKNWLNTLHKSNYLDDATNSSITDDCNQIIYLLIAIIKKAKGIQ